ncbi:MAG: AraC family transcriptional regulator ligand-binding domain-containing protein [Tateyamaria sp.]|uniref:AraC family transcriptional regulator n=1 Tax=Tateyamaria sp. TaxID=1929288 RepID=UPI00329C8B28
MNIPPIISAKSLGAMPQFALEHLGTRALDRALERVGLPHRFIQARDGYIPKHMLAEFIDELSKATGEQSIGLCWAPYLTVEDYGAWGAYVLSAPDLGEALKRAQRVMPFHSSSDHTSFDFDGDLASYSYHFMLTQHCAYPNIAYSALGVVLSIFRHYLGSDWCPTRIHCDFARPSNADDAEAAFGCQISWNTQRLAILFPREFLSSRRLIEGSGFVTVEDVARERMSGPPNNFSDIVAALLRLQLETDKISVDNAARALDMGIRTFQRRLRDDNLSFRELSNHVVMGRALELLRLGTLSVGMIATELGYNDPNNFSRAFRDWYGVKPTEHTAIKQVHQCGKQSWHLCN